MPRFGITRNDIIPIRAYLATRRERRREITARKRDRRIEVGPHATFHFESYETMWFQVHEMLAIEEGGEARIEAALEDYNPLVPRGRELVATVIFEFGDPVRRKAALGTLGGVAETMAIAIHGEKIRGRPEQADSGDRERAASWVQFVHFDFTAGQIAKFRTPGARVAVSIEHPSYRHASVMPETVRKALATDFA